MAYTAAEFDSYVIRYQSGSPGFDAIISCYKQGHGIGGIFFVKDGVPLADNQISEGRLSVYFPLSRFSDVMMILREERPLYLAFDDQSKTGGIYSGAEPVGEQGPKP